MKDLTIISCNCNTPDLITNLFLSIKNVCKSVPKMFVVETGHRDSSYFVKHTNFGDITYTIKFDSSHGEGVNLAMGRIKTDYILLVDSDVLLSKDVKKPFDKFKESGAALMGNVSGDRGGKSLHPRVDPWFCFMNLKQLKEHNIKFFDPIRTKRSRTESRIYDVGSTMFEDVMNAGLTVANVNLEGKYFTHYEGMSWRIQKYDPNKGDTDIDFGGTHDNKAMYEYGLKVKEQYEKDTEELRKRLWI